MTLMQTDWQSGTAWPDCPLGEIWWTNTFYWDTSDPPVGDTSIGKIDSIQRLGMLSTTYQFGIRTTHPPKTGENEVIGFVPRDHGLWIAESGYAITDVVRLTFRAAGSVVGYKLWRMPVPASEIVDGKLSADLYGFFTGTIVPGLLAAKIYSWKGVKIEEVEVSPFVHHWKLRRGGKRRCSMVIPHP